ncbi:flagellar biosynthesis protein FlhF [Pseudogracilibacillus sp. SE30717A]|uniref:flagellar biosynthesis protein FlhF n=1 Tax=Pseudogracilibacillus sp. SE30717A TaxID=3098293 RepID=UPI00300E07CE
MKVKKFIAKNMPEAMNKIRKELGSNAVILNSKEKKSGGIFGLFQKKSIEVIAALDEEPTIRKTNQSTKPVIDHTVQNINKMTENKIVLEEIKQLQHLLETQSFQSKNNFPPMLEHAYMYLLDQDVNEQIALKIIKGIEKELHPDEISKEKIVRQLKIELKRSLEHLSLDGLSYKKQIIQFVGPTGVGKTTTLAKVAALSMLEKQKKVAFITADTYRIAAIEQLKTYARILNVPVEVAYSLEDYRNALISFSDYDLIFVDTAGRNFRDPRYVKELQQLVDFEQFKMETCLVLALTAKASDILSTYNQFKEIAFEKVIFTKMDETATFGSILNIGIGENKDIAYITNGQDVPDDIMKPDKDFISKLLISGYEYA